MAAYKFELKAETSLREAGFEVFLPKETIYVKKPRRRPVAVERPAISTLIFVHATRQRILDYKRTVDDRLKFRLDLSSPTPDGRPSPLTVPTPQMATFISIWASRSTLHATLSPIAPLSPQTTSTASTPTASTPTNPTAAHGMCGHLPVGTQVDIIAGPLAGHRATLLRPLTARSRTARLSLTLASLLTITLSLPASTLSNPSQLFIEIPR